MALSIDRKHSDHATSASQLDKQRSAEAEFRVFLFEPGVKSQSKVIYVYLNAFDLIAGEFYSGILLLKIAF